MEALSIDALRGMLARVADQVDQEAESGDLSMSDGDSIRWETTRKPVVF